MNYEMAKAYLDSTNKYGSVLGLLNIKILLEKLGNPQDKIKVIHIAGTNGKGSVLNYIANILYAADYKVGMYSSPFVFDYLEIFRINFKNISKEKYATLVEKIKKAIEEMIIEKNIHPTTFEIETALAYLYFYEENCDYAIIETGLGGDLDATNVVQHPICSVITSISMDHMQFLGNTIEEIATHKAGIIKNDSLVVAYKQEEKVMEVINNTAINKGSKISVADVNKLKDVVYSLEKTSFIYKDDKYTLKMLGYIQPFNAIIAIEVANKLNINKKIIEKGLNEALWPGRFEILSNDPLFIIDGAHNEDAAVMLRKSIDVYFKGKKVVFIMGVLKDKDYLKITKSISDIAEIIYCVTPNNIRALEASVLSNNIKDFVNSVKCDNIQEAISKALIKAKKINAPIIAFGSLSYLNEIAIIFKQLD